MNPTGVPDDSLGLIPRQRDYPGIPVEKCPTPTGLRNGKIRPGLVEDAAADEFAEQRIAGDFVT